MRSARSWRISTNDIQDFSTRGLSRLGNLIRSEGLTEFQMRVRTSFIGYCRGIGQADLNDRLVQTLSSLDGLFLRDTSEPIQQNLGERVAFLIADNAGDRQSIVQTIKKAYNMRSNYIHHMISSADEEALAEFISVAHKALAAAANKMDAFQTGRDFIADIDRTKFGG